jgi:hypothetical protein
MKRASVCGKMRDGQIGGKVAAPARLLEVLPGGFNDACGLLYTLAEIGD